MKQKSHASIEWHIFRQLSSLRQTRLMNKQIKWGKMENPQFTPMKTQIDIDGIQTKSKSPNFIIPQSKIIPQIKHLPQPYREICSICIKNRSLPFIGASIESTCLCLSLELAFTFFLFVLFSLFIFRCARWHEIEFLRI